jgi:RNA polymerase sigma-70 factor (sigma-E family)
VAEPARVSERKASSSLEFEPFFRSQYPRLVRALYLLTGGRAEAEDLAQEAMARVYERWGRVREMASPDGYVYRVALHLNHRRLRRLLTARRHREEAPSVETDPSGAAGVRSDVMRALLALPAAHREVLVLAGWLGMETEEVSRVLGIKPSSVRSRLTRARAALKERLGEGYG